MWMVKRVLLCWHIGSDPLFHTRNLYHYFNWNNDVVIIVLNNGSRYLDAVYVVHYLVEIIHKDYIKIFNVV